jgi:predicted kinase
VQELARAVVEAGFVAIVDGAFLGRWQRQAFRDLATALRVPFVIVSFAAGDATLRKRIERRLREGNDESEADLAVLEHQLQTREPLGADETDDVVAYDTDARPRAAYAPTRWDIVVARINAERAG